MGAVVDWDWEEDGICRIWGGGISGIDAESSSSSSEEDDPESDLDPDLDLELSRSL